MRHGKDGYKLRRNPAHRRALLRNLTASVVEKNRVTTTLAKAKAVQPVVEKMISLGKRGDLHARRQAAAYLTDPKVVKKLFDEVAPNYADRNGGYTRVVKIGPRRGDAAPMAVIALV